MRKCIPGDPIVFGPMSTPVFDAMIDTAMLGAAISMFAKPGEDLGKVARNCQVGSRRGLLRLMRAMCRPGSSFRDDAESAGMSLSEPEIQAHIVSFVRSTQRIL